MKRKVSLVTRGAARSVGGRTVVRRLPARRIRFHRQGIQAAGPGFNWVAGVGSTSTAASSDRLAGPGVRRGGRLCAQVVAHRPRPGRSRCAAPLEGDDRGHGFTGPFSPDLHGGRDPADHRPSKTSALSGDVGGAGAGKNRAGIAYGDHHRLRACPQPQGAGLSARVPYRIGNQFGDDKDHRLPGVPFHGGLQLLQVAGCKVPCGPDCFGMAIELKLQHRRRRIGVRSLGGAHDKAHLISRRLAFRPESVPSSRATNPQSPRWDEMVSSPQRWKDRPRACPERAWPSGVLWNTSRRPGSWTASTATATP